MALLQAVLLLLLLASLLYHLLAWALTHQFVASEGVRERPGPGPAGSGALAAVRARLWPAVSMIKPIHRVNSDLRDGLVSFLGQDYPGPVEILLTSSEASDELQDLARELTGAFPSRRVRLLVGQRPGSNRKIAACIVALEQARHDLVVLSDADMRVPPDYLRRVVQPFADPRVGLVTCLYAARSTSGLGAALEGLSDADFSASVLVARRVEGLSFALGATMAFRRQALAEAGGLEAVRDYLADDYHLGHRVQGAGWKLALAGVVVEDLVGSPGLGDFFSHQLRWMRTYRLCRPGGHVAFLVTQGLPWSLGYLACVGGAPVGWWVLGGWLTIRALTARSTWRLLAGTPAANWGLVTPLKDLLYLGLWFLSLGGSTVRWGQQLFRVGRDGRMEPL